MDSSQDAEHHAAGDTAPRAIVPPALAFEPFFPLDVTMAQWTDGQTGALSLTPPAASGQGKAPDDSCLFLPYNDLASAGALREGGECA